MLFPLVVDYMYGHNMMTDGWLSFLGSYSGGIIGGFVTMITVYFTIHFYEQQQIAQQKNNDKNEWMKYMPQLMVHTNKDKWVCSNIGEYQCNNIIFDEKSALDQLYGYESKEIKNFDISDSNHKIKVRSVLGHDYIFYFSGYEVIKKPIMCNGENLISGETMLILTCVKNGEDYYD